MAANRVFTGGNPFSSVPVGSREKETEAPALAGPKG